ncbi:MAG: bile acid:sodium symporter [Pusillimonas sp.]
MVLPLMVFHLLQLVVSSMLAQRWRESDRLEV